ncbi:MAG: FAD-dependent oxidoreductase [Pseudonocardiaceae bacterium]
MNQPRPWNRVVVIGAGITGLAFARALSDFFSHIVVVERDRLPRGEDVRPGVPQARLPHGMLIRGAQALEELFPGMSRLLREDGAPSFDFGEGVMFHLKGRTPDRKHVGLELQTYSRNFLEWRLRCQVEQQPGTEFQDGLTVTGLTYDPAGRRVTGIHGNPGRPGRNKTHEQHPTLDADLVIDASGRTSKLPAWLADIGYTTPEPVLSHRGLEYVTCVYDCADMLTDSCRMIYEISAPDTRGHGGIAIQLEDGRMLLTLIGPPDDPPSTSYPEFVAYAKTLSNPLLGEITSSLEPATPLRKCGLSSNRRIDYHRMRWWPDRLLAVGDSYCAFNPVYAQGMTVGILEAVALRSALHSRAGQETLDGFARPFQRTLSRIVQAPWVMALTQDSMYQNPHEKNSLTNRVANWYMNKVFDRVPDDPNLYHAFLKIAHMMASPGVLARPRVLATVLRPRGPARGSTL